MEIILLSWLPGPPTSSRSAHRPDADESIRRRSDDIILRYVVA
jgi:hypothetical protein